MGETDEIVDKDRNRKQSWQTNIPGLRDFDFSVFRNPAAMLHFMGIAAFFTNLMMSKPMLLVHGERLGIATSRSALLHMNVALLSLPARVASSWVTCNAVLEASFYTGVMALACFLIPVLTTYPLLLLYCVIYAVGNGGVMSLEGVILVSRVTRLNARGLLVQSGRSTRRSGCGEWTTYGATWGCCTCSSRRSCWRAPRSPAG